MNAILMAIGWAGAGSAPFDPQAALMELGVAVLMTAGVAALARRHEQEKKRLREDELQMELEEAVPVAGVH